MNLHPPTAGAVIRPARPGRLLAAMALSLACLSQAVTPVAAQSAPTPAELGRSIDAGVRFLLARQRADGAWSSSPEGAPPVERDVGRTALVALALLNTGQSHQSEPLQRATAYLRSAKAESTYNVALRAAYFSMLPEAVRKDVLAGDLRWLQAAVIRRGPTAGMYTYRRPPDGDVGGDYSNSQYGVLGAWYAAAYAGRDVPGSYWKLIDNGWRDGQQEDGGWGYTPRHGSYGSMTAAGIATLFVTYDALYARQEREPGKPVAQQSELSRGVAWLDRHFAVDRNPGRDFAINHDPDAPPVRPDLGGDVDGSWVYYMLFSYERVGEATGLTRFGRHRWFDVGARFLLRRQQSDGGWPNRRDADALWRDVNTAYALLFLSRGRAPVVLQKLQFEGRWNNRSRDAAQLTRWIAGQTERHLNWQIASADATPAELRESPILYLASDQPVALPDPLIDRLRQYVLQGGVILAVAEGPNAPVAAAGFEQLGRRIFPGYAFRDVPEDHLLFTANFPVRPSAPKVRSLGNGVRELFVLLPEGDLSWAWQRGAGVAARAPHFGVVGNLHLYMTDRSNPRFKGDDAWVEPDPAVAVRRSVEVARIRFDGIDDPEPAGWQRLAAILRNRDAIGVNLTTTSAARLDARFALAHLTATGTFELTGDDLAGLRRYADAGGLALFEAVGGSAPAGAALAEAVRQAWPASVVAPLPLDHPVYQPGEGGRQALRQVTYRKFAIDKLPRGNLPRLKGVVADGKLVALLSEEDLSSGLVGHGVDGIIGYSPGSATSLMRNLLLLRMNRR